MTNPIPNTLYDNSTQKEIEQFIEGGIPRQIIIRIWTKDTLSSMEDLQKRLHFIKVELEREAWKQFRRGGGI